MADSKNIKKTDDNSKSKDNKPDTTKSTTSTAINKSMNSEKTGKDSTSLMHSNTTNNSKMAVDTASQSQSRSVSLAQSISSKGGEQEMAKDPKGMFDYSKANKYVVKKGDTLLDIALQFKVGLEQIRYFNHIDKLSMKIRPGKTLYIPTETINIPVGE